ncbi:MAG: cytochrome c [Deltaproteobacteria bacterium]|nr:cytochrome c [Deltaproteobacteria bacterium]
MARSQRGERGGRVAVLWCVLACGVLLLPLAPAQATDPKSAGAVLAFSRHSESVARRSLASLLETVPPASVRVYEPYEDRVVEFSAWPFARVLDAVYSKSWRSEEELLFTCIDGYQPSVPVARVLSHSAWLAFDRADQPGFTIRKQESGEFKRVELGPFYLIWENLKDEQMRQEADYGWPYQLVSIDLIRSRDRFPKMIPPPGAPADVLAGFAAFRVHCSKCHKLNGEGGSIGPELNAAASPVELRDPQWLRAWIEEPGRIRPETRMPPLNPALPERARTVDEILAYLRVMATARSGPEAR